MQSQRAEAVVHPAVGKISRHKLEGQNDQQRPEQPRPDLLGLLSYEHAVSIEPPGVLARIEHPLVGLDPLVVAGRIEPLDESFWLVSLHCNPTVQPVDGVANIRLGEL